MRKGMTETIYMMGERHPHSTKPMRKGRPLSSGKYATRAELETEVIDRRSRGYSFKRIGRIVGVSYTTVGNIIKAWKEKQSEQSADRS
jgi:hypothetical protein